MLDLSPILAFLALKFLEMFVLGVHSMSLRRPFSFGKISFLQIFFARRWRAVPIFPSGR